MITSHRRMYAGMIMTLVKDFYAKNPQIKVSHGIKHVLTVHHHAVQAISAHTPPLTNEESMQVESAALLHDVDDTKYFPDHRKEKVNAISILNEAQVDAESMGSILQMIEWVSASQNGNSVPPSVETSGEYFRLIPRWADRLEAVGVRGVVRCYQYTLEKGQPLWSEMAPRARSEEELWKFADPQRFVDYQASGGNSKDMISHYFDKLLHVARPPPAIVRNSYLEKKASESAGPLVEVCLQYGVTGKINEGYLIDLEALVE